MFTLHKTHSSGARRGTLVTPHGSLETPFFMPIATKGAVKTIAPFELAALQQRIDDTTDPIVLSNTYHLYLKPGLETLEATGGLHGLSDWPHTILTDSGGFQVFSLARLNTLTDDGVDFRSHLDGSSHFFTPERSMEIQSVIGSDVWMAFDYFPGYPAERKDAERSVQLTTDWARRCREWQKEYNKKEGKDHLLFGIVQGSTFEDLRKQSSAELQEIGFDGYAIGGLAVGEPAEEMYKVVEQTTPTLPKNSARYLMGVGPPEQILEAVRRGVDMFDCVIPSRNARHGTLFVHAEGSDRIVSDDLSAVSYEKINIRGNRWKTDNQPLDAALPESGYGTTISRAYLRHLFSINEPLAARIATAHNITFYMKMMREIRKVI